MTERANAKLRQWWPPSGPHMRLSTAWRAVLCASLAVSLSGCFDLHQHVRIDRFGGGSYQVSIAAAGLVGQALRERPARIAGLPAPVITVDRATGVVRQTSGVHFRSLDDLKLPDEVISLRVLGHAFFGLGPAHVRFRRTFLIGNARNQHAAAAGEAGTLATPMQQGLFKGHVYVFSVTLPGSVLKAQPLRLGRRVIIPVVRGNFWDGHTVTWTVPMALALQRQVLSFAVDFSAYGRFSDVESVPYGT